ncbi:MAG: arsenosugar biosynthesis radical SAM protein ArsS [Coriobacteriia bacterium]|nr:arsenosugar biosynthesis radical SAM protein ArsS [Coriobacteriia bacterium]
MQATTMHQEVSAYYASLSSNDELKTDAPCCTTEAPPRYVLEVMPLIADEIVERFYGCGSPIPPALEGCTVLDLGCGTGRDVYVLSKLVGPTGRVIGVDMTPEQLDVARKYQQEQAERFGHAESNVEFKLGYIEDLKAAGIEDESVDLVVSNCVVNLSPFKDLVFKEIHRVLKPGGELYFSDVYSDRRMPDSLRHDPVMVGECLGGALYLEDFRAKMNAAGFGNFVFDVVDEMHVGDLSLQTKIGFMSFTSRTVRAIKVDGLEPTEEDYGQYAVYNGGMPEMPRYFDFDQDTRLIKNKPRALSGNQARMLEASRYGKFCTISKPREHRGPFDADAAQLALEVRKGRKSVDARMLDRAYEKLGYVTFEERVGEPSLLQTHERPATLQVNVTYKCNLACRHCYLDCNPKRTETMSRETMEAVLEGFTAGGFTIMDVTGGSPEMHPDFPWFLEEASKRVKAVGGELLVRSNLTLLLKPEYQGLMDLFARTGAHVISSVPYYNPDGTDSQRGAGVFKLAMEAVRELNKRGYGMGEGAGPDGQTLVLDLVYNVAGPFLPLPQDMLEEAYKVILERDQGVRFNSLFAFNNYALGRFAADLLDSGMFEQYLSLLANNFNAMAVTRMMCLDQVNVNYDGRLYDCEVNHVLELPIQIDGHDATVQDLANGPLPPHPICTSPICYSCTAGSGSSCGGALI